MYTTGAELPDAEKVPDTTLVFTAEPVSWEIEFRCYICDRQVMTLSSYLREGELTRTDEGVWEASQEEHEEARAYIETLLADAEVEIPPAIVIDIGKIHDRGWAVIEANSSWGAGIYGCDPEKVLLVLARACIRRDHLSEEDKKWALQELELEEE